MRHAEAHGTEPGRGYGHGRLAQLVEHLVYTERVGGSSPSAPTTPVNWQQLRSEEAKLLEVHHAKRKQNDRQH